MGSQGWLNGISSKFSAAPIRATHTAGGQTDAAISIGQSLKAVSRGETPPSLRKALLNAFLCAGMAIGGFASVRAHKRLGLTAALLPAGMLAVTSTVLPALIAPSEDEKSKIQD